MYLLRPVYHISIVETRLYNKHMGLTGVLPDWPIARSVRGIGTKADVMTAVVERHRIEESSCMLIYLS